MRSLFSPRFSGCLVAALVILALAFGAHAVAAVSPPAPPPRADEISILHCWPNTVPADAKNRALWIVVTAAFTQESAESAVIHLEADTTGNGEFLAVDQTDVRRGRGTTELRGWVKPVGGTFARPVTIRTRLVANGSAMGPARVSQPLTIPLGERKKDQVDSILILGCEPEKLVIGEEAEISVLVSYELNTAEEGEINLGFNSHAPNGYTIRSSKTVKKGKGQVALTARVTPRAWNNEVFFKAFVNLSELPHASQWSPLANDSEPIELEAR